VLDTAKYSAFESTLNSSIVSYRKDINHTTCWAQVHKNLFNNSL